MSTHNITGKFTVLSAASDSTTILLYWILILIMQKNLYYLTNNTDIHQDLIYVSKICEILSLYVAIKV